MAGAWKQMARKLVLPALYRLRVFDLLVRCSRRPFAIVMYHGVHPGTAEFPINSRHLPAKDFEEHLRFFRRNFELIPLSRLAELLGSGRPLRGRKLVLTFDDGYRNNLLAAALARNHRAPLTVFVGTGVVRHPGTSHHADELDFMLLTTGETVLEYAGQRWPLGDTRSRRAAGRGVGALLKQENSAGKERRLRELAERLRPDPARRRPLEDFLAYLTEEDLRTLGHNQFVEVGSHSVEHHNLDQLSAEERERELQESRAYLEEVLGRPVTTFSYPDGSYDAETRAAAARHYACACAVNPRLDRTGRDLYELPRLGFSADDTVPIQIFYLVRYLLRRS